MAEAIRNVFGRVSGSRSRDRRDPERLSLPLNEENGAPPSPTPSNASVASFVHKDNVPLKSEDAPFVACQVQIHVQAVASPPVVTGG